MLILQLPLIALLAVTIIVSLYRFGTSGAGTLLFTANLFLSFVTLSVDTAFEAYGIDHALVYRISNHIELIIVCLYFNESIPVLKKRSLGLVLAVTTFLVGLVLEFISSPSSIGSLFLGFEGLVIIGLGMFGSYQLFVSSPRSVVVRNIHFWLAVCMSFLWCTTLLSFSLYDFFRQRDPHFLRYLVLIIWVADYVSLTGMLLAFCLVPRSSKRRKAPAETGSVITKGSHVARE